MAAVGKNKTCATDRLTIKRRDGAAVSVDELCGGHAMPWATGFLPLPKNLANKQTASNDDTRTCLENEMEIGDAAAAAVG